jgi:lysophospholipase L1-like esterase
MMKLTLKILFCVLLMHGWVTGYCFNPACQDKLKNLPASHFNKMTEGKIVSDITIPDAKELTIYLLWTGEENDENVFTIPLISGSKLYPQNITPDVVHRLEIEFDLRYNFCKVFIDGAWLTSVLSRKQYDYINSIIIECPLCNDEDLKLANFHAAGSLYERNTPLKIVAFGNSTTAYRKTITGVYSQRLPEYFKKQNIPVLVFNEGIGGSHTGHLTDNSLHKIRHALDRFDDAVLAKNPDFVTFNFGLNDSWVDGKDPNGESRIPLDKFRENLLYMINTLKDKNITAIIMTPNAFGDKYELWRHKRTEKYVKAVRSIAKKENLPFIDQWEIMNKLAAEPGKQIEDFLLPDEMHTNDQWHNILAEHISELIIDLLNDSDKNGTNKH